MFEGLFNFTTLSNHLIIIGVFCILALSLNLINGSLGVFSLGHHGFWGMGGYVAAVIAWALGSPQGSIGVFLLAFVCAMLASAVFGLLVGTPCLRLRGDYLAIATLGFAEIFIICVRNSETWFGERGLGGAAGFSIGDGFSGGNDIILTWVGGSNVARQGVYLALTWLLVAATYLLIRNIVHSAHGRAIHAIRDDEIAAELLGVNLFRYKALVFVIGAALAGMAGALYANYRATVSPANFLMMEGIKVLLMVVLGGLGSMSGSIIAVIVLYASEQALGTIELRWPFLAFSNQQFTLVYRPVKELWQVLYPLVLIVLMLRWPRGLTRGRELTRAFFSDWLAERRASFTRWVRHPFPVLVTWIQWAQLLWALSASEGLFADAPNPTPRRIAFLLGAVIVFFVGGALRRRYWKKQAPELAWAGVGQA